MLLFRVLPAILSLADCVCALIPKPPNYEGENYNYDLTYQPPLKIFEEPQYRDDSEKTDAIAEAFRHSWRGYYTYAFPKDTLNPLSGTFENDLSGFGSTAIESLTTAIIMGEKTIMDRIMWFIGSATFTVTKLVAEEVNVYEATIRLIGSMVSAYDLLNGPYRKYASTKSSLNALLDQAVILTDVLKVAFGSDTRIPAGGVLLTPMVQRSGRLETTLGAAGGMGVELDGIHHRSGLKKLWKNFVNGFKALIGQPILHDKTIPGLFPDMVNTKQGGFFSKQGGYTKNTAPFYHGMIKLRNMDSRRYKRTAELWVESVEDIMKHLTSHPMNHRNLTFLAGFQDAQHIPRAELTSCSAGAMFILGGATLRRQRYIDFGLRIAETCWTVASSMPSGLPPRAFKWIDAELTAGTRRNPLPPVHFETFANKTGFWPTQRSYTLDSDLFETMYYAYRMTGDIKWQDRAWDMFVKINSTCRVSNGFVGINDVTVKDGYDMEGGPVQDKDQWINKMEGEWMSRTLKYLYLMFAPNGPWQLRWDGDGAFVFSHGGHPIQKPLWRSLDAFGHRRHPWLPDWDEVDPRVTGGYQGTEHEG
ncbi:hypothetical protein LCI18_007028 [Fusarium solani-melongenae]|uniref:Uncharacterized protein n=1 Tax=Fusarium solani subsp. cucurbitae TaxID=2747967 RepID=A0ACD3Z7N6_FUSSC|nr:hypothetical protein LCI18_007028 [Fusarium solani-melongenae]